MDEYVIANIEIKSNSDEVIGAYASPREALKEVGIAYDYWSGKLTDSSSQMCYAVIAGNWFVYGSIKEIFASGWAMFSLFSVLLTLSVNLIFSYVMAEWMRIRFECAEKNSSQWKLEFKEAMGKPGDWPYPSSMKTVVILHRLTKTVLPIIAGVLLIIGAIYRDGFKG